MKLTATAAACLVLMASAARAVIQQPGAADIRVLDGLNGNADGMAQKNELIAVVIRLRNDTTRNVLYTHV